MTIKEQKNIYILGGGFAGIYAALSISRALGKSAQVTIINRTNHFLFTPMLHEVATGGLGHHQVVEPAREIVYKKHINFIEASITSVDSVAKTIMTDRGTYTYDMLVVALGSKTHFFDTKGAREHSLVLKDLEDAITIRNTIISAFENASHESDDTARAQKLSFVVVGGGPTGVETVAEIADLVYGTLRKYYKQAFSCKDIRITLVQSGKELLPTFDTKTRAYALTELGKQGIDVRLDTKVHEVSATGVVLSTGETIAAETVIWTAGVKAEDIALSGHEVVKDGAGRIVTDSTFQIAGVPDVFAIGDVAAVPREGGGSYPMLAQVAVAEARALGTIIAKRVHGKAPQPFRYSLKGELVSLGRWKAAGTILGFHIHGKIAWFMWRTVYLFKFISKSKKMKIAMDWTVNLFFPRDISKA